MKFYDKDKRKTNITALANALSKRDTTPINTGSITPVYVKKQDGQNVLSGAGDLLNGGMKLYNGLQNSGLFNGNGANTSGLSLGNYFGSDSSGSMVFDNIMGNGGSGSMTFDNIGGGSGGGFGYIGLANGLMNGINQGFNSDDKIMGGFGNGLQGMFGVDSDNDSDVMQGIKGTVNGATTGAAFGPWGALIGGILGLGSSFLDDF